MMSIEGVGSSRSDLLAGTATSSLVCVVSRLPTSDVSEISRTHRERSENLHAVNLV